MAYGQLDQLKQLSEQQWKKGPSSVRIESLPPGLAASAPPTPTCDTSCVVKVWVLQAGDPDGLPLKCTAVVALNTPLTIARSKKPTITWIVQSPRPIGADNGIYEFRNAGGKNGIRMRDGVEFGRRYHGHPVLDIAPPASGAASATSETWQVKNQRQRDTLLCAKEEEDDGDPDDAGVTPRRCEIHYAPYVRRKAPGGAIEKCVPLDPTLINKGL
jgi:hypothetical protein